MELSIDTSTGYASVCLSEEGAVRSSLSWFSKHNHSVELLPIIDNLLNFSGSSLEQISCIFVAKGPGRFSALRVGMSVAKGLAMSQGIPILGFSTLWLEACVYREMGMPVCALLDAGRNQMASSLYDDREGGSGKVWKDQLVSIEDLVLGIKEPTIFCGEGVYNVASALKDKLGSKAIVKLPVYPTRDPSYLAKVGYEGYLKGIVDDVSSLEPVYLRGPSITSPRITST